MGKSWLQVQVCLRGAADVRPCCGSRRGLTFEEEVESLHSSPLLISAAFGRAASEPMASTALGFCRLCATYACMHPELTHVPTAAMHASHNARAEDGPEVDNLP